MPKISNLISRVTWKARYAGGFDKRPLPFSEWWAHHSVTIAPDLVPPFDDDDEAIQTLERIGQQRFGGGISYTVAITPVGRAYEGHEIGRKGAHTGGRNTVASAICFVGNYETHELTPQQEEAAARTLVLSHREGFASRHTFNGGHRQAPNQIATACPGRHVLARIPAINARAEALWDGGYGKASVVTKVTSKVVKKVTKAVLAVDGILGARTIAQWQLVMGTTVDGVISKGPRGSELIRAVQRRVGVTQDGFDGPITWRAIQRRLGVKADGIPGPITIKALQRRLNAGQF